MKRSAGEARMEVYPVYIEQDKKDYIVYVPDFDIYTSGTSMANAIVMARDAIGIMAIELEDEGSEVPKPFSVDYIENDGALRTLVDIDFQEYRRKHDTRMVKKNCTIPYYLNEEAEKLGINFSRLLQEALMNKIYG